MTAEALAAAASASASASASATAAGAVAADAIGKVKGLNGRPGSQLSSQKMLDDQDLLEPSDAAKDQLVPTAAEVN
jgi:hypothetical protein